MIITDRVLIMADDKLAGAAMRDDPRVVTLVTRASGEIRCVE